MMIDLAILVQIVNITRGIARLSSCPGIPGSVDYMVILHHLRRAHEMSRFLIIPRELKWSLYVDRTRDLGPSCRDNSRNCSAFLMPRDSWQCGYMVILSKINGTLALSYKLIGKSSH